MFYFKQLRFFQINGVKLLNCSRSPPPTTYCSFILEIIPAQWVYRGVALAVLAVHMSTV